MASEIKVDTIVNAGGDNDTGIDLSTNDQVKVKIAGSTDLTFKANEIENSSGDLTFDVAGDIILDADGGDIRLSDDGTQFGKFTRSSGDFTISSSENDKDIIFAGADGGADISPVRIDMSDGGIVIFSTTGWDGGNDSSDTNVVGVLLAPAGAIFMQLDGNTSGKEAFVVNNIHSSGATATVAQYRTQNSTEGSLIGNSSGLSISNNSDYRKKERITDLTGSVDVIKTLKPRQYYYREGFGKPTRAFAGFIAHEVQDSLLPHMTNGVKDAVVTKENKENDEHHNMEIGDPVYQTVAYGDNELITRLVGAVQELSAKIETLEAKVTALESK